MSSLLSKERKVSAGQGFTLIELLIVIAIIGILAGIAVPLYLGQRTKAATAEATSNLQALRLLEEQFFAENACYNAGCANGTINTTTHADGTIGFDFLPGFRPGNNNSLNFTYQIVISGDPSASEFVAIATGKGGSIVSGSKFCLDQNNNTQCP
jgi:prepilin-type N-terminal cleavage/methylation domain-containing protein